MSVTKSHRLIKAPKKRLGYFVNTLIFAIVIGLFLSWILNFIEWQTRGYSAMMQDLQKVYRSEAQDISWRSSLLFHAYSWSMFMLKIGFFKISHWISPVGLSLQSWITRHQIAWSAHQRLSLYSAQQVIQRTWLLSVITLKTLLLKCIGLLAFFWVYCFSALLGAVDGLVSRYVRTLEAGRESTFLFHKVSDTLIQFPAWIVALYIVLPLRINSALVACLLALSFFGFFHFSTSHLKKFL